MKYRIFLALVFLLCALALMGCAAEKMLPQPAQEAAAAEAAAAPPESVPDESIEPEPIPEPEPLPAGEEILLFGARTATLTDGGQLYVEAVRFAERAGLSFQADADGMTLCAGEDAARFALARSDALADGAGFLQHGAAYLPLLPAAERFGFVTGRTEEGTLYLAKLPSLAPPKENVNVPVLMYHALSDEKWGYWDLFVSPSTLEEELIYMQENGYEAIWFEDLSHVEDYEKPVILTFDDGYDDNYTELFPLLQKYNVKATIFVIPKAIGTPHKMTAEQIYELSQSGLVSIQSHTYSHGNLSTMDEETLVFEMEASKNYLAALTGQVPYAVCYPEGTRSELSIEVAGRYYAYGLLMNGQLYNTSDDPLRVKRYYIPRGYDLGSFVWSIRDAGTSRAW